MNFAQRQNITIAVPAAGRTAGAADINAGTVDMSGYEGVTLIVEFGAIVANAVVSVKWQQGDESDASDMTDLAGTSISVADDDDDKILVSELYRPTKRYVRAVISRATQNATLRTALYVRSQPMREPTVTGDDVQHRELYAGPAEGSA